MAFCVDAPAPLVVPPEQASGPAALAAPGAASAATPAAESTHVETARRTENELISELPPWGCRFPCMFRGTPCHAGSESHVSSRWRLRRCSEPVTRLLS